jgi:hypothetical protein
MTEAEQTSARVAALRFAGLGYGARSAQRTPSRSAWRPVLSPHLETGAGGDRRRRTSVDRADDLAAVYALQVDARNAEVRVSGLPLDHDDRDTFVRHLDCVSVSQLVWCEPRFHSCGRGGMMQLLRAADAPQRRPAVGPWITHSSAPIGSSRLISSQGSSWSHAQRPIPTSRRLPPFPRRTTTAPRARRLSTASLVRE